MRAAEKHRRRAEQRLYGYVPSSRRPTHARKRRAIEPAVLRRRWLLGLSAVFAALCVYGIYHAPIFNVRTVRVTGMASVLPEEAEQARVRAVIAPKTNLFRVKTRLLAEDIQRLPWVASVNVSRHLLSTIEVQVTPRATAAVLVTPDGRWELDKGGEVIRLARAGITAPEITSTVSVHTEIGSVIDDPEVLGAVAAIGRTGSSMPARIGKIEVDQNRELCLNMQDNVVIRLGRVDDLATKLALVTRIYQQDPDIGAEVQIIDLRCPEAPACIPRIAAKEPSLATDTVSGRADGTGRLHSSRNPLRGVTD